jgi:hypothetical protein
MEIEESVIIRSTAKKVWETFTDLSCWTEWNSVMGNVSSAERCLTEGKDIKCSFRPFFFPIRATVRIEELTPVRHIAWSARKKGLFAFHEFFLEELEHGLRVTSRERLTGILACAWGLLLPVRRMRSLTRIFLRDLKTAAEK